MDAKVKTNSLKSTRWKAHLTLGFEQRGMRTVISNRQHTGPLVIQKPFYPEGNTCHVYLLHPPGGLVGGDELLLDVTLAENAHTLITTPGASKFYRCLDTAAQQKQQFHVASNALLEWMPQESIIFNDSRACISTTIDMQRGAKFIGWEILCLGRPAGNHLFTEGFVDQNLQLSVDQKPLLIERALFEGNSDFMSAKWGLANHKAVGTMLVLPGNADILNKIREQVSAAENELFSATLIEDHQKNKIIVCRYLGSQAENIKKAFIQVWEIARPYVQNTNACIPRIWNT